MRLYHRYLVHKNSSPTKKGFLKTSCARIRIFNCQCPKTRVAENFVVYFLGYSLVSFSLPNGYHLKNTEKGVDIGGFVFDDVFVDIRPFWASDIIACRDHNYRLVYSYVPDADASSDQIENSQDQKS